MTWLYKGQPLETEESIPVPKAIGFIYLITQLSTGKRYIGRKLLTRAGRKTVNGKTKKIRLASDWQNYWSSSPDLKELIAAVGTEDFRREILVFVTSKGSLAYLEEKALYALGALETDSFFNGNIRSKIFRSWVKVDEAKELTEVLKTMNLT
ncbi:MAG: hypothetical protein ACYDG4_17205 [Desulfuromonadaceae bacterium]